MRLFAAHALGCVGEHADQKRNRHKIDRRREEPAHGFRAEEHTDALAAAATLGTVTGGRLGAELRLLLREPQPQALLALERVRALLENNG